MKNNKNELLKMILELAELMENQKEKATDANGDNLNGWHFNDGELHFFKDGDYTYGFEVSAIKKVIEVPSEGVRPLTEGEFKKIMRKAFKERGVKTGATFTDPETNREDTVYREEYDFDLKNNEIWVDVSRTARAKVYSDGKFAEVKQVIPEDFRAMIDKYGGIKISNFMLAYLEEKVKNKQKN